MYMHRMIRHIQVYSNSIFSVDSIAKGLATTNSTFIMNSILEGAFTMWARFRLKLSPRAKYNTVQFQLEFRLLCKCDPHL